MVRFTLVVLLTVASCSRGESRTNPQAHQTAAVATFAGGCFWCVESAFDKLPGVFDAVSGYTGGSRINPSYGDVSSGKTKHLEAVQVRYDPKRITYGELLSVFWRQINPTDSSGQFADRGHHYRTAIFVHDDKQRKIAEQSRQRLEKSGKFSLPIATVIRRAGRFYPAEDYHQDYHRKNPQRYKRYYNGSGRAGYIRRVWGPPPKAFRKPSRSELRRRLSRLQYHVTQQNGTERAFQNRYWNNKADGIYVDIVSGEPLFSSRDKFKSGTGWPSFFRPLEPRNVITRDDRSHGMARTEVRSRLADSHLGHLFHDGPRPTRLRYCINSASLRFVPKQDLERVGLGRYLKLFK